MSDHGKEPATQTDLRGLRDEVKGDIAGLARKIDVVQQKLGLELMKTHDRMDKMEVRLNEKMDEGFHRVTSTIDSFLNKIETYGRESLTVPKTIDAHGKKLRDHEGRIQPLESSDRG